MVKQGRGGPQRDDGRAPAPKRSGWRSRKPGRLASSMVGLSAAAIASVYAVGYFHTETSGLSLSALPDAAAAVQATSTPVSRQPSIASNQGTNQSAPRATPTAAPGASSASALYKDGSYKGVGTSRHGNIEATVVVSGGKIVSAAITNCQTRYPCSAVTALTNEVVARQGVPVDYVSGASDSSQAYRGAVTRALAQAKAV
ncbi:MAG: FMN-binding protein [Chloroflexi bacterium]|nr:FMN-binding protein [Chloroflexota bacterium]